MNDAGKDQEKLLELDRKLAELRSTLADRVERLTERVAAPLDALEEGLIPALKQGEVSLREAVDRYPIGSVAAAVAAGAATTYALRRRSELSTTPWMRELEPYWNVAGEALRSLGVAAAAGVVEGALRVVDNRQQRATSGIRGNLAVVRPESVAPENDVNVGRPL